MNRKKNPGIWLRREQNGGTGGGILPMLTCAAALYAAGRLTGHALPWVPVLAGVLTCGGHGLLKKRGWFYPAVTGAMVLMLLLLRGPITAGFCQWYNRMGDVYTAGTGLVLPALEVTDDGQLPLVLFSVLWGMGAGTCFCALSGRGRVLLSAVTAVLMALCATAFAGMPVLVPVLLLCTVLLCRHGKGEAKALLFPMALLGCLLLAAQIPAVQQWAQVQSAAVRAALHGQRYETKYTTLPEGTQADGLLPRSSAPALVVTMEKPEELYLRGFTGAVLEENAWEPLDTELLARNEELLYWLNRYEFDLRTQFEGASAALETQSNTVTVQNIGACSRYRYVPFSLRFDDGLRPEDLSADGVKGSGSRYDVFTTVYDGAALLPQLLETLEQTDDEGVLRYRQAEAAYREFVTEHYLTVPEDAARQLSAVWEQAAGQDPQEAVRSALALCFPDGPEHSPRYASAAVLTLRHFGIPARYAEGYIVPDSEGASIQVDASCAACWAEVYHDGIGWIPMALTPGLDGEEASPDVPPPPSQEPEETIPEETQAQAEPEPSGGERVRIGHLVLHSAAAVLGLLLLAFLMLVLRRQRIMKKRRARFEQDAVREAVTWIFTDAVAVLARMGIHRGGGSLAPMTGPIRQRFGDAYARQFRTAAGLNTKALFSSHELTGEDRALALAFREETLAHLKENSNWLRRLWMQWVLCLY